MLHFHRIQRSNDRGSIMDYGFRKNGRHKLKIFSQRVWFCMLI